ncbi:hypothetical protein [Streptomyces sp. NRRL S-1813]|uniref:hypothetical protein n=1 Tax=Streptomyces sp. NRRL S-1813 TaxID=1463888 RepID=UPI000ABA295B|nr:hypothetical protein [Streptomyces sp. NRRL S-1813]
MRHHMADHAEEAAPGGTFSHRDRAVICAAALSMLIVQMDWFALDLMLAVDQGQGWGWAFAPTLAAVAVGIASLVLFVVVERRTPEPLIDLSLFRKVKFDVITLAGSLSNVVYCLIAVLSALYLQQARGLSPFHAGVIFLALSCGVGAAGYGAGRLACAARPCWPSSAPSVCSRSARRGCVRAAVPRSPAEGRRGGPPGAPGPGP